MPVGYSGTPLRKKLGLTEGSAACLVGVPETILAELEPLPSNYDVSPTGGPYTFVLIFAPSRREFETAFADAHARLAVGVRPVFRTRGRQGLRGGRDVVGPEVRAATRYFLSSSTNHCTARPTAFTPSSLSTKP